MTVSGSLAEAFREVALSNQDRIAVHDDAAALSYSELASQAGGIARALLAAALRPGERAGLLLDHGSAMVAAAVGTLAAGGCYVPLDPGYPAERLAHMTSRAGVRVLLTSRPHDELGQRLASGQVLVHTDDLGSADLEVVGTDADQPAYLLYTSGSTGLPKGVAQTHRNVLHGVANHITGFGIGLADKVSLLSSFSFDMAVTDMYAALLSGATVVTVDVRRHGIGHLADALADRGVTVYHSTPTAFEHLVAALGDRRLPEIRVVLLGGEHVTKAHVLAARRHFGPGCVFANGYGATEASFAARYRIGPADQVDRDVVPIGYPLPGYEILLLDRRGRQRHHSGEIAIKSRYLSPGYWQDEVRTAERFAAASDGTPIYRTGDFGSVLADGRLVCLGRADRQVKIRGHRVELGEIEAHLAALPEVAHAVVLARGDGSTESPQIVGYVVPATGARPDPVLLRRALAERLPDYLLPAVIVVMSEFPLTPSGKVDVAALPAPRAASRGAAPSTATERLVAAAWCEVLGLGCVGVDSAFFDSGGHSLAMARVQRRLESALGREIPLAALAEHATVRTFARYIDGGQDDSLDRVNLRMARRRASRSQR